MNFDISKQLYEITNEVQNSKSKNKRFNTPKKNEEYEDGYIQTSQSGMDNLGMIIFFNKIFLLINHLFRYY